MSTVVVSNVHFEPTGNNRIQVENSGISIYQNGVSKLSANVSGISISNNTNTVNLTIAQANAKLIGSYTITTKNTAPSKHINVGTVYSKSSYPTLSSIVEPSPADAIFVERTSANTNTALILYDIAYGNGVWVVVGANTVGTLLGGSIQSSTDGLTWTNRTVANTNKMYGVGYGNGIFIAVGSNGALQTSTDGTTWTNRTSNSNNQDLYNVAYGNGVYVAVGGAVNPNGTIISSTDGTTWIRRTAANVFALTSVAFGNGTFVVAGGNAAGSGSLQSSTDGTTWTNRTVANSNPMSCIAYGNGIFVTGSDTSPTIQYSTDNGVTWSQDSVSGILSYTRSIVYGNGIFMAVGAGGIAVSTDAITWSSRTTRSALASATVVRGIEYNDNVFYMCGNSGGPKLQSSVISSTEFYVRPHIGLPNDSSNNYIYATAYIRATE